MLWKRVAPYVYESKHYRVAKVKGGWMLLGRCDWLPAGDQWRSLYRWPLKTCKEAKSLAKGAKL